MRQQLFILFCLFASPLLAQDTLLLGGFLPEVVFQAEKSESERLFAPQQIEQISSKELILSNPKTTAEALQKNGAVMVQMSQSGGGSPIIRGFEANRVLLVMDGVRLNNAIFRSGHLQNLISTSPYLLERMDIIFGPASVKYGSDALGGVIHLHSKTPTVGQATSAQLHQTFSSVNNGVGSHFDLGWSKGKWAFLHGASVNHYGNLHMGKNRWHGYADWGQEAHITNGTEQLHTAYQQADFLQKIRYDVNDRLSHLLNIQYSTSTDLPRFDKLNDVKDGVGKYVEWKYGPQKRFLSNLSTQYNAQKLLFDEAHFSVSFQKLEESRASQKLGGSLNKRQEDVQVFSTLVDLNKNYGKHRLNYGFDAQHNIVNSSANEGVSTRYADGGSELSQSSAYIQFKYGHQNGYISSGLRYSINHLSALFIDTATYHLPFNNIQASGNAFTGSLGAFQQLPRKWEGSLSFSSGYRSPNVDDLTKVFAKSGMLTVPNNTLNSEYSYNGELTLSKRWEGGAYISGTAFYTLLKDAIVKAPYVLNGQDSLWYEGELLPLVANQNIQQAQLYGLNLQLSIPLTEEWSTKHSFNLTRGVDAETQLPLDHIPPTYGRSGLNWKKKVHAAECYLLYNDWKRIADYSLNGSDNPEEATIDGTPSWWTLNLQYTVQLNSLLRAQVGVENIFDIHYKTYASGISAPGRNIMLALHASF